MSENKFSTTVSALFSGMDSVISSKTVVGAEYNAFSTFLDPFTSLSIITWTVWVSISLETKDFLDF